MEPEIASEAVVTVPPRKVPAGEVETARRRIHIGKPVAARTVPQRRTGSGLSRN